MPLWGNQDTANNAPKYHIIATNKARGNTMYGNTTPGAFKTNQVDGVFGLSTSDVQGEHGTLGGTPGWYLGRWGTGPVLAITPGVAASNGYANTDTVLVSGGIVNAVGNLFTNATGGIVSVTVSNPGAGFPNTSVLSMAVMNANNVASSGTGGSFTVKLGGRAGRKMHECLVTVQKMTNNVFNFI